MNELKAKLEKDLVDVKGFHKDSAMNKVFVEKMFQAINTIRNRGYETWKQDTTLKGHVEKIILKYV